jgi:CheY-like chemotaxis protein
MYTDKQPSPPDRRVRRVLVADDNRDAGETLAMLLRLEGHEVHVAIDGLQAVELFVRMKPDVAILDIGMPGLSGHDVARQIRKLGGDPPVKLIAVTGWGQQADCRRSTRASACCAATSRRTSTRCARSSRTRRPRAS